MINTLNTRIALASTFHDASGDKSIIFIKKHIKTIKNIFKSISLVLTDKTAKKIGDFLTKNGVKIIINPTGRGSLSRKNALIEALKISCDCFLSIDFDRLLFWLEKYPNELLKVIKQIKQLNENDYLVIGRTDKAWNSHPTFQKIPEEETNDAISKEINKIADVTSGCRAFGRKIALSIVKNAKAIHSGISDTEWPMIVHLHNKANIKSIFVDGLSYETELIFGYERAHKAQGEYEFSRTQMKNASIKIINQIKKDFVQNKKL